MPAGEFLARNVKGPVGCFEGLEPLKSWSVDGSGTRWFNPKSGVFTVPQDGLYTVRVDIRIEGTGLVSGDGPRVRKTVDFCLRIQEPASATKDDEDAIDEDLLDVGARTFGEVLHLRKDAKVTLLSTSTAEMSEVTLSLDLIQRKRKRDPKPELTKKEMKKLAKKKRKLESQDVPVSDTARPERARASPSSVEGVKVEPDALKAANGPSSDDLVDPESDSWSAEFSSDSSEDRTAENRGVSRVSKKLRASSATE